MYLYRGIQHLKHRKSLAIDIGFMDREWASAQMIEGGTVTIGKRLQPHIHTNVTWISDPRYPRGLKTIAQCNFESSDENRILRLIRKWGWKIVEVDTSMKQCGREETDNTSRGITHHFEDTDEIIGNWQWR